MNYYRLTLLFIISWWVGGDVQAFQNHSLQEQQQSYSKELIELEEALKVLPVGSNLYFETLYSLIELVETSHFEKMDSLALVMTNQAKKFDNAYYQARGYYYQATYKELKNEFDNAIILLDSASAFINSSEPPNLAIHILQVKASIQYYLGNIDQWFMEFFSKKKVKVIV